MYHGLETIQYFYRRHDTRCRTAVQRRGTIRIARGSWDIRRVSIVHRIVYIDSLTTNLQFAEIASTPEWHRLDNVSPSLLYRRIRSRGRLIRDRPRACIEDRLLCWSLHLLSKGDSVSLCATNAGGIQGGTRSRRARRWRKWRRGGDSRRLGVPGVCVQERSRPQPRCISRM